MQSVQGVTEQENVSGVVGRVGHPRTSMGVLDAMEREYVGTVLEQSG